MWMRPTLLRDLQNLGPEGSWRDSESTKSPRLSAYSSCKDGESGRKGVESSCWLRYRNEVEDI